MVNIKKDKDWELEKEKEAIAALIISITAHTLRIGKNPHS